jgi:hypothetical protein
VEEARRINEFAMTGGELSSGTIVLGTAAIPISVLEAAYPQSANSSHLRTQ